MNKWWAVPCSVVAAAAFAGCSGSGSGATVTVTRTVIAAKAAAPTKSKAAPKPTATSAASTATARQAKGTTPFGATWTSKTGRTIKITKPVPFTPSDTAAMDKTMPGAHVYVVTITLSNPATAAAYDPSNLTFTVTSGSTQVDGIFDSANGVGDIPTATMLPGRSATWKMAYQVVPGTHLSIQIDDMATFSTLTIFDGVVH